MKLKKFSLLLAILLILSSLLSSCQIKKISPTELFCEEFSKDGSLHDKIDKIEDLEDFSYLYKSHQENIIVFKKPYGAYTMYRFYNLEKQCVVNECVTGLETEIYLVKNNVYVVKHFDEATNNSEYVAYDFAGNELARQISPFRNVYDLGDHVFFNNTFYMKNEETGALMKRIDIPLHRFALNNASATIDYNDEYYYVSCVDESDTEIYIYNRSFELIHAYSTKTSTHSSVNILNDGKLIVQYALALPKDATIYDFFDAPSNTKYDLKTVIVDPKEKNNSEINFDYVISELSSSYSLRRQNENYSDSFENVICVYPIIDKTVYVTDNDADLFYMDNNGKLSTSLKLIEGQTAELPERISEDRYLVNMINGSRALVDSDWNVRYILTNTVKIVGEYLVTDNIIYDLDMNVVYDTSAVGDGIVASILGTLDGAVIVSERKDDDMIYYSFLNGEKIKLHTIYDYLTSQFSFALTDYGCIVIGSNRYTCYNVKGEELISINAELERSWSFEDHTLVCLYERQKNGHTVNVYYSIYK